jgi:hypothetical protein
MTPLTPPRPRAWPEHSTPPQQVRSADQAMQK